MELATHALQSGERPVRPMPPKNWTLEDFAPVFAGEVALPNEQPVDPGALLNDIAARGHMMTAQWGYSLRTTGRDAGRKQWTQFFTIGHIYAGTGYAIVYGGSHWDETTKTMVYTPVTVKFALCNHEKVEGPGANPSRGWNPGFCKHCGMDMSVDSGD